MDAQPVLQFYAPLVGLLVFSFALGMLWQRVKAVEKAVFKEDDVSERLIRLEVQGESVVAQLGEIKAQVEGVHREINELMRTSIHSTVPAVRVSRAK